MRICSSVGSEGSFEDMDLEEGGVGGSLSIMDPQLGDSALLASSSSWQENCFGSGNSRGGVML